MERSLRYARGLKGIMEKIKMEAGKLAEEMNIKPEKVFHDLYMGTKEKRRISHPGAWRAFLSMKTKEINAGPSFLMIICIHTFTTTSACSGRA